MHRDDFRTVPLDRYPDPAATYVVEDDASVVRATNDSFDATFGPVSEGESLTALLDRIGTNDIPSDALTRTGRFTVHVRSATPPKRDENYLARVVPPTDEKPGYVLFADVTNVESQGALDVDSVASVVSHDLRNPLDVAKARLRAGRELNDDEHFEHVARAHDRMERIIEDVMTVARGEERIEPDETVDLEAVAESAWEMVETDKMTLDVAALPETVADHDRLTRLFENLFRNSVEHGSNSGGKASTEPDDGGGTEVRVGRLEDGFYVEDDGPGIPEDERERVFEPGYSSSIHGTGLGLTIVERIADAHGWTVELAGGRNGGTRVKIHGVDFE